MECFSCIIPVDRICLSRLISGESVDDSIIVRNNGIYSLGKNHLAVIICLFILLSVGSMKIVSNI